MLTLQEMREMQINLLLIFYYLTTKHAKNKKPETTKCLPEYE